MAAIPKKPSACPAAAKSRKSPKSLKPKAPKPLDYMLAVLRDEAAEPGRRDEMAKLAAPYVHAKARDLFRETPGAGGKARAKDLTGKSDADPLIRTARATLQRKLARLAAKGAAEENPGGAQR